MAGDDQAPSLSVDIAQARIGDDDPLETIDLGDCFFSLHAGSSWG